MKDLIVQLKYWLLLNHPEKWWTVYWEKEITMKLDVSVIWVLSFSGEGNLMVWGWDTCKPNDWRWQRRQRVCGGQAAVRGRDPTVTRARALTPRWGWLETLSLLPKTLGEKFPQAASSGQKQLLKAEMFLTGAGQDFMLCPHGRRARRDKAACALKMEMESKDLSWDHVGYKLDVLSQNGFFISNIFTAEF